jgi:hypothetical protein
MPARSLPAAANQTREERIEAILKELRPKIEATVRQLVERAVDVPEAEEFGAIDFEFRDAGPKLVHEVRQASVASRKSTVRRMQRNVFLLRACGKVPLAAAWNCFACLSTIGVSKIDP